jgi:hypothetical protein
MCGVGKHSGARVERPRPALPRRRRAIFVGGITVTLVAWCGLVWAAIEFGKEARGGSSAAWALLGLAALGAAACLYLTLLLGARMLEERKEARDVAPPPPPRIPGGRRAAR